MAAFTVCSDFGVQKKVNSQYIVIILKLYMMFSYLDLLWVWFFGSEITILPSTEILRLEIEDRINSFLDLTLPVSCIPISLLLFATISLKNDLFQIFLVFINFFLKLSLIILLSSVQSSHSVVSDSL